MRNLFLAAFTTLLQLGALAQDADRVYNFEAFTVGFNDSLKMSVWASYKLTSEMISAKKVSSRKTPYTDRESLKSTAYVGTGLDRGHMAPFAAMDYSEKTGRETFSMLNIVGQWPFTNRGVWKTIEDYEAKLALRRGCVYVFIKNSFEGDEVNGVPVPRSQTKIINSCSPEEELARFTIYNIK